MTSKIFLTRHVMRGWFRRRAVLQVKNRLGGEWRDATKTDLDTIADAKDAEDRSRRNNGLFPVGQRVRVTSRSGFSRGAHGVVVFQEPNQGRVWVQRDGADSPSFFYGYELCYEPGTISAPHFARLVDRGGEYPYWWITLGDGRVASSQASEWCEENAGEHMIRIGDTDDYDPWVMLIGFETKTDATMFYMRFL